MIYKSRDTYLYTKGEVFCRTVAHKYERYINVSKNDFIFDFIDEYRRVFKLCLNEIWKKKITWKHGTICLKHNMVNGYFPKYLNVTDFNCLKKHNSFLSGRMRSQILKDLCSILRGLCKSCKSLKNPKLKKPNVDKINVEIAPKFIEIIENDNKDSYFTHYIKLINLTNIRNENKVVPIRLNSMDDEYLTKGFEPLKSILLSKNTIDLRYRLKPTFKDTSKNVYKTTVGCDMGVRKILTTSDGKTATDTKDGKSFKQLNDKIKRKKKNSTNYKKAIREMECFIQETVKDLNLHKNKKIRLEHNKNLKRNTGNANHHWSYQVIIKRILKLSQDNQVGYILTPPSYKSQRCNDCGFVHRKNRKGEMFKCLSCYHEDDADINSAKNNKEELPFDNLWSVSKESKDSGFFWLTTGVKKIGHHALPNKNLNSSEK